MLSSMPRRLGENPSSDYTDSSAGFACSFRHGCPNATAQDPPALLTALWAAGQVLLAPTRNLAKEGSRPTRLSRVGRVMVATLTLFATVASVRQCVCYLSLVPHPLPSVFPQVPVSHVPISHIAKHRFEARKIIPKDLIINEEMLFRTFVRHNFPRKHQARKMKLRNVKKRFQKFARNFTFSIFHFWHNFRGEGPGREFGGVVHRH